MSAGGPSRTNRSTQPSILGRFAELAYVTANFGAAKELFRDSYGVKEWMDAGVAELPLGGGRTAQLRIAVAYVGRLLLEIIEPINGEIEWFRAFLPAAGGLMRLHHLAFISTDAEEYRSMLGRVGERVPIRYEGSFGAALTFFFADARTSLGHYLEYVDLSEFGAMIPRNVAIEADDPLHQITGITRLSYVSSDYERSLARFRECFGVSAVLETELIRTDLSDGAIMKLRSALAYIDGIQFEIIESVPATAGSVRQTLPTTEEFAMQFHSAAFASPTREHFRSLRSYIQERGERIVADDALGSGSSFFLVDASERLGHQIGYLYLEPEYCEQIPRY
jgi:hypothetical protein